MLVEPPGDVGVLGGIFGRLVERDLTEGNGLLAGAAHVLERDAGVAEVPFGKFVHAVAAADPVEAAPRIEVEADDHRILDRRDLDVVAREDIEVVFAIVQDLDHRIGGQQRAQRGKRGIQRHLVGLFGEHVGPAVGEGDVAGIVRSECEADADEVRRHAVERARLGIDGDQPCGLGALDPVLEALDRLDAFIGAPVDLRHLG